MPSLLILIPAALVILINLPVKEVFKRVSFLLALLYILAQVAAVIFEPAYLMLNTPQLFALNLVIDSFSLLMLLSISIVGFSALCVGWYTLNDSNKKSDFVSLLLLSIIGMNGVVMVRDLFSLYVFLEVVAIASFILIALDKDHEALEGSFKYFILSAVATVMMLTAVSLLLMVTGDTSFVAVGAAFKTGTFTFWPVLAMVLFVVGLFIKAGVVPFHGWLPDAYSSAPAGVSVLLAGIVTKVTGVYTLIRLVTMVFGFSSSLNAVLLIVGAISIIVGALGALGQKDMKRMLAYSSISQVGYIIISLGAGTPLGIAGAVFHLFNHSVFKSLLFVNAAAVEEQTSTRDMDKLGGLAEKMPITGITSVIALLSTAGIPPLAGFWSKLIIIMALWAAGLYSYAVIAVLASVLTLAYFLSMTRRVYWGKVPNQLADVTEARAGLLVPALVLAAINIGVGLAFPYILNTFILPIRSIFG